MGAPLLPLRRRRSGNRIPRGEGNGSLGWINPDLEVMQDPDAEGGVSAMVEMGRRGSGEKEARGRR